MRIQVRDARTQNERGATAVLTAALALVMIGLSAFTLDFGRAYVSKRNLQTGADAGSLAAAAYYTGKPGSCVYLTDTSPTAAADEAAARARASAILQETRGGANIDSFVVGCNPQGELTVNMSVTGSTPVAFGAVYGASSITTQREAEATVEVPESVGRGLRPYAICSFDAPLSNPTSDIVVKVSEPGQAHSSANCPTGNRPGNWWTADCPEDNNNGNGTLADATRHGCSTKGIRVVPDQPVGATPSQLSSFLIDACPNRSLSCLSANPGEDLHTGAVTRAWDSLLGKGIVLPVFCGDDECDPAAVTDAGGNNAIYPIMKLASVIVCGYHWKNDQNQIFTGKCANNPNNLLATQGNNQDNYMLLVFTNIQVSGSTDDSECALGDDSCDGNARQIRLTK